MAKTILIDPVTRIEGHAKITLHLDAAGNLADARFHVTEFRGFEKFCEGRSFREMPAITSRICGICPVSHLLASAKTGDALLRVEVPPAAVTLRRLMNLGQILQSHALSFFHLSGPDLFLGFGAPVAERNIVGLARQRPDLATAGIRLRKFGQQVIEHLGGKRIHSAWAIPGGVTAALPDDARAELRAELPAVEQMTCSALAEFKSRLDQWKLELDSFGAFPSLFLGLTGPNGLWEHYEGVLTLSDANGQVLEQFEPRDYQAILGEAVEPWSFLKFPFYRKVGYPSGCYRVGPLARVNLATRFGTTKADQELVEFRQRFGRVATSSFLYHYARLLEMLTAVEQIGQILDAPASERPRIQARADLNANEAVGVSEAPRGTLFHHYVVDDHGILKRVNLVIATGQNNLAMNASIRQIAEKYLRTNDIEDEALNRIEAGIRAFDPCLSCSTHAAGRMPLHVQLLDAAGSVVSERVRGSQQ